MRLLQNRRGVYLIRSEGLGLESIRWVSWVSWVAYKSALIRREKLMCAEDRPGARIERKK